MSTNTIKQDMNMTDRQLNMVNQKNVSVEQLKIVLIFLVLNLEVLLNWNLLEGVLLQGMIMMKFGDNISNHARLAKDLQLLHLQIVELFPTNLFLILLAALYF